MAYLIIARKIKPLARCYEGASMLLHGLYDPPFKASYYILDFVDVNSKFSPLKFC